MTTIDRNRLRKAYSYFRSKPVLWTDAFKVEEGDGMLIFTNTAALSAYSVSDLSSGQTAFVQTLRDVFFLEKSVNPTSSDGQTKIAATDGLGVWHRLMVGWPYWQNQSVWYIDAVSGNDENIGSASNIPLRTNDEFMRRFAGVTDVRDDYTVFLFSTGSAIECSSSIDVTFDNGGSITYTGSITFTTSSVSASSITGSVDYTNATFPQIKTSSSFFSSASANLIAVPSSSTYVAGWFLTSSLSGVNDTVYTTTFTTNPEVPRYLGKTSMPRLSAGSISARGNGTLLFSNVVIGHPSSSVMTTFSTDDCSTILFSQADISAAIGPLFNGGNFSLSRSRISYQASTITLQNDARVLMTNSGVTKSPAAVASQASMNILNSRLEAGSTVFVNTGITASSSKLVFSTTTTSCSGFLSSSMLLKSDSVLDVRNAIGTSGSVMTITGQSVTLFFDDSSQPKAEPISIMNGTVAAVSWSAAPYNDMMRSVLIASGSLSNTLL